MIVKRPHTKIDIPPGTPGVERVAFMNILGVIFQENMSFTMQVDRLVARGAQTMYAIGTLKNHGLNNCALWEVTRATLLSRLTQSCPRVGWTRGSGRVGSRFCRILAGRVGSGQHFGFFSFLLIISWYLNRCESSNTYYIRID